MTRSRLSLILAVGWFLLLFGVLISVGVTSHGCGQATYCAHGRGD
jgi:hypothetical protein